MSCSIQDCNGNDKMPYECRECGRKFCSDHRLPEDHNCIALGVSGSVPKASESNASTDGGTTASNSSFGSLLLLLAVVAAVIGGGVVAVDAVGSVPSGDVLPNVGGAIDSAGDAIGNATNDSLGSEPLDEDELERLVHEEINEYRVNQSVGALEYDRELARIAEYHSDNMAANGEIYHTSPSGQTMGDRYERFSYDCRVPVGNNEYKTGGENVLKTYYMEDLTNDRFYSTPEELAKGIVQQWINSEPHRENLVDADWRRQGIGINITEEDGNTAVYVTENFC